MGASHLSELGPWTATLPSCSFSSISLISAQTLLPRQSRPWSPRLDGAPGYMPSVLPEPPSWHLGSSLLCVLMAGYLTSIQNPEETIGIKRTEDGFLNFTTYCPCPVQYLCRVGAQQILKEEVGKERHRWGIRASRSSRASCWEA